MRFPLAGRAGSAVLLAFVVQPGIAQQLFTQGDMRVSPSGSLQYVIPIKVAAGTAGMQPNLALVYDSGVGPGAASGGWALTGLSRILRCPRTLAQDGVRAPVSFTINDGYCLDGERLILVSGVYGRDGAEYRTERDSYSKIVSNGVYTVSMALDSTGTNWVRTYGGPVSFTVYGKSGQVMEFGSTGDSQITGANSSGVTDGATLPLTTTAVKGWALKKVKDVAGNYMTVTYKKISLANDGASSPVDDGAFFPTRIDYTGNSAAGLQPTKWVELDWSPVVANSPVMYQGGYPVARSGYLKPVSSIRSYAGPGAMYRRYDFDQDYSRMNPNIPEISDSNAPPRLSLVTENIGFAGAKLPSLIFGYEPVGQPFQFWSSGSAFPGTRTDYQQYFVDVNGDGKKHWIQISQNADEAWIGTIKANGTFAADSWTKYIQSVGALANFEHYFADVNGDGKADWIRVSRTTNEGWVALGTGNGNFQFWSKYTQAVGAANTYKHTFVDVDGDGKADWVQSHRIAAQTVVGLATTNGDFQFWSATPSQAQLDPAVWDVYFADVNGDKKIDLLTAHRTAGYIVAYLSQGGGVFVSPSGTISNMGNGAQYYFADINGDGNADVLAVKADGSLWYALSKGDGSATTPIQVANAYNRHVQFADVNGDGLDDLLLADPSSSLFYARPSTGDNGYYANLHTLTPSLPAGGSFAPAGYQRFYADLNGDGKADLIFIDKTTKAATVALGSWGDPYRITSIKNPARQATTISYKPLNDSSVYTPDSNATYPLRDSAYPLLGSQRAPQLVAAISAPNGIGGTVTTNYTYGGLKTDLSRGKVMGFRWMQSKQAETGITLKTEYRQDWPYTGNVATVIKSLAGAGSNGILSQTTNTYGCNDFVTTGGTCTLATGRRYWPYLLQSTTSGWDLNGAALPGGSASYVYDGFGNATRVTTNTTDGHSTVVDTTYSNDTSKWWLGKPLRVTETVTTP